MTESHLHDVSPEEVSRSSQMRLRWWLAFMFFLIGLIAYMDRSNISVVAEPMMKDFNMDKVHFGILASLFSLGYALAQIPGGILSEVFGPRKIVSIAMAWWSVFTALTAMVTSYGALGTVRFLFGVGEGPMYPASSVFNSYWFQSHEKGRAASALLAGSYFGPVIAPAISVAIYQTVGWHGVFYVFAIIGLIIAGVWYIVGRDRPENHPWIGKDECFLILANRSVEAGVRQQMAPWRKLINRIQFWAIGFQYFIVAYMTTLFMTWLPTYLQEARHFSLSTMGIAASFPWLAIVIVVVGGGAFSDFLIRAGISRVIARGGLAMVGLTLFMISIVCAGFTSSQWLNVLWLTIALGSLGLPVVTSWAVAADVGKQYSGSVSGWMNLWGNIGGVLSPLVCGWFAQHIGWDKALMVNIVPIVFAMLLWFLIKPDRNLI